MLKDEWNDLKEELQTRLTEENIDCVKSYFYAGAAAFLQALMDTTKKEMYSIEAIEQIDNLVNELIEFSDEKNCDSH